MPVRFARRRAVAEHKPGLAVFVGDGENAEELGHASRRQLMGEAFGHCGAFGSDSSRLAIHFSIY